DTSGEMAPPSTTIPSGGPRETSQRGNRCSNSTINVFPMGERPRIANATKHTPISHLPVRDQRVASITKPTKPIDTMRSDGLAKKPRILDSVKNMPRADSALVLCSLVPRLGVLVHGVKARQLGAALNLADDPGFHAFVLGTLHGDERNEILRDHHCAVIVTDNHVTGKYGAAAAADRLLPAHKGK